MNGGDGDDTLVWNNGDGNDVMNGDAGVDRIEDNLGAGDDVSTLKTENGRVRYDRTNAGAFNLSIAHRRGLRAQHARRQRHADHRAGRRRSRSSPTAARATTRSSGARHDRSTAATATTPRARDGAADFAAAAPAPTRRRRRHRRARPTSRPSTARATSAAAPAPAAGAASIAKTAKVKKGVASLKLSCPAGTARLQRLRLAVLDQGDQGRPAQGPAAARPPSLLAGGRRDQDDQGQARLRHGQAGQEEEARRLRRRAPTGREATQARAAL